MWAASALVFALFTVVFGSITSTLVATQAPETDASSNQSPEGRTNGDNETEEIATDEGTNRTYTEPPAEETETVAETQVETTETAAESPVNEVETAEEPTIKVTNTPTEFPAEETETSTEPVTETPNNQTGTSPGPTDPTAEATGNTPQSAGSDMMQSLTITAQIITILSGLWSILFGFGSGLMYLVEQWSASEYDQTTLTDFGR